MLLGIGYSHDGNTGAYNPWAITKDVIGRSFTTDKKKKKSGGSGSSSRIGATGPKAAKRVTRKKTSGGYASGWRPGTPAVKSSNRTQGGYAAGWRPGISPVENNYGAGSMGAGGFGGGMFGATAPPDYNQMYKDFLATLPTVDMPDAEEMVRRQFDPQYDLISQLRTQTTGRYNQASDDTEAMYNALAQAATDQSSVIAQQYDTTAQNIDAAFSGATNSINDTATNSIDYMTEQMKRLGIGEAAPDAFSNIGEEQMRAVGNIAGLQSTYGASQDQLRQSAMDYMADTAQTQSLAGANAVTDIERRLQEVLSGYDNKQLEVKANEGQTLNDYLMQIAQMQNEANAAAQGSYGSVLDQIMGNDQWMQEQATDNFRWQSEQDIEQARWEAQNELDRAKAAFDVTRWEDERSSRDSDSSKSKENWDNNAVGQLNNFALQYFPNNPTLAGRASDQIITAFGVIQPQSAAEFLNAIKHRFPNNPYARQYDALAMSLAQAMGLR